MAGSAVPPPWPGLASATRHPCPSNTRHWFRQFLFIHRCLDKRARATPAQPASGGGCLPQPRWAVCATGAGAHQGQTSCEGQKHIWWTAGTMSGGTGHLGLTHTETQRGRLQTACGQRRVDSKNSQTTPATTSTTSIRQLLGAADAQTAHHATFSTAPTHQLLGSANVETTPARAPAAAANRTQRPDATCEGKDG